MAHVTHIGAFALGLVEDGAGGAALVVAAGAGAVGVVPIFVIRLLQALVARVRILALAAAQILAVLLIRIAVLGLDAAIAFACQMLIHIDNGIAPLAARPETLHFAHAQLQRLYLRRLARDQRGAAATIAAIDARARRRIVDIRSRLLPGLLRQWPQLHNRRLRRAARWRRIPNGS